MPEGVALQRGSDGPPYTVKRTGALPSTTWISVNGAGSFALTVTKAGTFSGKLLLGSGAYSLSGQFSIGGDWSGTPLKGRPDVMTSLHLNLAGGDQVTGTISTGQWAAGIVADRSVYSSSSPAPQAGQYTLVIPGNTQPANLPGDH